MSSDAQPGRDSLPPVTITIDGRPVTVPSGASVLDAARRLDLDIPTLCHLERCGPMTSCLVCVVKLRLNGRTSVVPSCGMKAVDGMEVESETAEVHELRRSALELLLSDHVGDCLSPCTRICPLGLNIPVMLRQVERGQLADAAGTVREAIALPGVVGRLCHRPCENGCRRSSCDSAAAIRDVEQFVADAARTQRIAADPACRPSTGKRVVIVGGGPTALAAAFELVRAGHACVVKDRNVSAGGSLRREVEQGRLPADVLDHDLAELARLGVVIESGIEGDLQAIQASADAVLLVPGELTAAEAARHGVAVTGAGLKVVDPATFLTSEPGVFTAGSAVRPVKHLVKAMAEGQSAAEAISAFLSGLPPRKAERPFSSVMGRLESSELKLFLEGAHRGPRIPVAADVPGYTSAEAATESSRCLHCDCRARGNCRLQHYSQAYGAEFGRFPRHRRAFEQHSHPARVLFEPGKCILCGICVKIAEEAREPLGLSFVGRGFEVRVSAPLHATFEAGLQKVAAECAEACPTGAIAIQEPAPTRCPGRCGPSQG